MIRWHDRAGSTMDLAQELAQDEMAAPHGTAVAAREQTGGRGRRGRAWIAPPGGLWLSIVLRPASAEAVECLGLRAGLAVADALESALPGLPGLQLKWPNDLMLGDRKIGGLLGEARWDPTGPGWIVLGIGVNLTNPVPDDGRAGSLADWAGGVTLEGLAEQVVARVARATAAGGPLTPAELNRFRTRDWLRGRSVHSPVRGRGAGVDPDGNLRIEDPEGVVHRIGSGEVVSVV